MRNSIVMSLLLCCSGCIQSYDAPARSVSIRAIDAQGQVIDRFLVMRLVRSENIHGVEDPPKDHWRPPEITHMALTSNGLVTIHAPPTATFRAVIFAPFIGLGWQAEIPYRVYAPGYEVWRGFLPPSTELMPDDGENGSEVKIELVRIEQPPREMIPSRIVEVRSSEARHELVKKTDNIGLDQTRMHLDPTGPKPPYRDVGISGSAFLCGDLSDDAFWRQVEARGRMPDHKDATRFLCEYYVERIAGHSTTSLNKLDSKLRGRISWLRSVTAAE